VVKPTRLAEEGEALLERTFKEMVPQANAEYRYVMCSLGQDDACGFSWVELCFVCICEVNNVEDITFLSLFEGLVLMLCMVLIASHREMVDVFRVFQLEQPGTHVSVVGKQMERIMRVCVCCHVFLPVCDLRSSLIPITFTVFQLCCSFPSRMGSLCCAIMLAMTGVHLYLPSVCVVYRRCAVFHSLLVVLDNFTPCNCQR
jgi:hypothetical protein